MTMLFFPGGIFFYYWFFNMKDNIRKTDTFRQLIIFCTSTKKIEWEDRPLKW